MLGRYNLCVPIKGIKILILKNINIVMLECFMACSARFNIQSEGSISQLLTHCKEIQFSILCSSKTHIH